MRKSKFTVGGKDVQEHTDALLRKHVGLKETSGKCTVAVLIQILCAAAARLTSIFAACAQMKDAPSGETAWQALLATLPDYVQLQKGVNRALAGDLPPSVRRRQQRLAIDLHLIPYYGQADKDPKELYRSQSKAGTTHFHAYASACIVFQGQRFTVALTPVEQGELMKEIVQRLLALVRKTGVRPGLLLLDRGFCRLAVIRYLQRARVPFLMAAMARGQSKKAAPATGIRAFQKWKRSGWGQHTMVSGKDQATMLIGVHCGNNRGRRKKRGRYTWVYIYWGIKPGSTRWLADTYRSRFGIETSYRQLHEARIKTCTRLPLVRLFFVALALILRNVWVWFHYVLLSSPRRGRRRLRLERLRFKAMLLWLLHVAESVFGVFDQTDAERQARPEVNIVHGR